MANKAVCKLCDRLVLSQAVTFAAGENMPVHMYTISYTQQFVMNLVTRECIVHRLRNNTHFIKKSDFEIIFQLEKFAGVLFADKNCVAIEPLVVAYHYITCLQLTYKIRIFTRLCQFYSVTNHTFAHNKFSNFSQPTICTGLGVL